MFACKACAQKDHTIEILKEQLGWMRTHYGTPSLQEVEAPPEQTVAYQSEAEQEVEWMLEQKLIDTTQAEAALQAIGAFNTEVSFDR